MYKTDSLLTDDVRRAIINCIVDFMVDAFGKGDASKISKRQKQLTAHAAINLFVGLKSNEIANQTVNTIFYFFL